MRYLLLLPLLFAIGCARTEPAESGSEAGGGDAEPVLHSFLEIYDVESGERRTVYTAADHFEAPNWTLDGRALLFNQEGRLYRIPVEGGTPDLVDTGSLEGINNDHGISPDGRTIVVSNNERDAEGATSVHMYTLPIEGGTPTRVTTKSPSYWHGWSPDGETLAYVAQRDGQQFDLYTIPVGGGEERQITDTPTHEDGPDYSPDGRYIYYNGDAEGHFDIWRVPAEGGEPVRVTSDPFEDWFPHPSPDGRHLVFLSYNPGTEGHPANQDVRLRMLTIDGERYGEPVDLFEFFGGQGTINVPSWSPDSKAFAYVRYELR